MTAKRWALPQMLLTQLACLLGWSAIAAACLCVGSTTTAFRWPVRAMLAGRLELVLVASLVGGALAGAGVVYQAVLRNPLADPSLLGVSSGAALSAFLWRFVPIASLPIALAGPVFTLGQQGFSFAGAAVAVAIVFVLSTRRGKLEPITLLLMGVIVNSISGSIFLLVNTLNRDITAGSGGELSFLVGGIQTNLLPMQEYAAGSAAVLCWGILVYLTGQLNVAMLSEAEATALGIRIHRLRWIALTAASLMTAAVVAISGPIGFVGLVCPHLARVIVGNDQRRLLPVATAIGAALLTVADAGARKLAGTVHTILPVGVITGLLGGPFYLVLLYKSRNRQ